MSQNSQVKSLEGLQASNERNNQSSTERMSRIWGIQVIKYIEIYSNIFKIVSFLINNLILTLRGLMKPHTQYILYFRQVQDQILSFVFLNHDGTIKNKGFY